MSDTTNLAEARIFQVTVDAHDPSQLAEFWSEALNRPIEQTSADVTSLAADAAGARLTFSRTTDPKTIKNRIHLDLATTNRHAVVDRLVARGATVLAAYAAWTVMADPEGNEFCVT